jgi:phosphoserine aminotransferase
MITNKKAYNFGAGPSALPDEVFAAAAEAVKEYKSSGLSILEISHRSNLFIDILYEAETLLRELMQIPGDYDILFLHGGGSQQFAMIPMNLLPDHKTAYYIDSGVWAKKAFEESRRIGNTLILASSAESTYNYIPKDFSVPDDAAYLHITTNNTIYGTQWFDVPKTNHPLIADASSDILCQKIDVTNYGLIYAGAQKNLGTAGVTIVIMQKTLLGSSKRTLPKIFDYQEHVNAKSLYNTAPVYAIYVMLLTLRWLQKMGGVTVIEKINREKAALLYAEIDNNPLFKGHAVENDRSLMNIAFQMMRPELEEKFLEVTAQSGIVGIKGHRIFGGLRVSLYNAIPIGHVHYLVDLMKDFTVKFG